jgi:hypothetical protein
VDELREAIRAELRRGWLLREGRLPSSEGEILARLRACADIVSEKPVRGALEIRLRIAPAAWERLRARYGARAPQLFGRRTAM